MAVWPDRVSSRLNRLAAIGANLATIAVFLTFATFLVLRLTALASRDTETTKSDSRPVGRVVRELPVNPNSASAPSTHDLEGQATLLYVCATTCPACERQKLHMESLLGELRGVNVLTASTEPAAVVANYWQGDLPVISLARLGAMMLGLTGVPSMIMIDSGGRIRLALLGSTLNWSLSRLQEELALALRPPP